MLKKTLPAAIAAALLAGAVTTAQAVEISGNVALTTNYKFRGLSQSNDDPAIQGGFDLGFDNGIYVGTWGSSVDFGTTEDQGTNGSLELDYYVGWAVPLSDNIGIDVGYIYYDYPGDSSALKGDYQEIYGNLSLWDFSLGLAYSDDYWAETGDFMYYQAGYSLGLGETFTVDFHIGYSDLDEEGYLSGGATSYTDYSIGVTASWLAVDWTLAWVGTDLDKDEYFDTDLAEDTVVFTVAKSL